MSTTIKPYSNVTNRSGRLVITVDRQGRLCLSSSLRKELEAGPSGIALYAGFDPVNKRIAIAKPHVVKLTDTIPYKFDGKRGYTMARNFLKRYAIPYDKAYNYVFDGKENGWWTFKLAGYDAPDGSLPDQPGQTEE